MPSVRSPRGHWGESTSPEGSCTSNLGCMLPVMALGTRRGVPVTAPGRLFLTDAKGKWRRCCCMPPPICPPRLRVSRPRGLHRPRRPRTGRCGRASVFPRASRATAALQISLHEGSRNEHLDASIAGSRSGGAEIQSPCIASSARKGPKSTPLRVRARRSPTRRYSSRISTDTTNWRRRSFHASRMANGTPEKNTPEMKTLVSSTTFSGTSSPQ